MYREIYPEDVNLNNVSFNDYLHLLEVSNKIRSLNLIKSLKSKKII